MVRTVLIAIPELLDAAELSRIRAIVDAAEWADGNATSGHQSALAKRNAQLPEDCAAAIEAGRIVLDALGRSALFVAAALPLKVFPPLFNRYAGGQAFDTPRRHRGARPPRQRFSRAGRRLCDVVPRRARRL